MDIVTNKSVLSFGPCALDVCTAAGLTQPTQATIHSSDTACFLPAQSLDSSQHLHCYRYSEY